MPNELENVVDQEQDVDPSYVPEAPEVSEPTAEETPAQES